MLYYYLDETNQQRGPVSAEQLRQAGCKPTTLVWREGMTNYQPANQLPELAGMLLPPPPPPAPPAPNVVNPTSPAAVPGSQMPGQPQSPKNNKTLIIAIAAVAVCVCVGVILYLTLGRSGGSSETDNALNADSAVVVADEPVFDVFLETTTKTSKAYFIADNDDEYGESSYLYLVKEYEIEWPDSANFDTDALKAAINKAMFNKSTPKLEVAAKGFLTDGNVEGTMFRPNRGSKKQASDDEGFGLNWSLYKYCHRVEEELPHNMVAFATGGYDDLGGAHGTPYQTGVINYDAECGKVVTYDDVFKPGCDSRILRLLKSVRKKTQEYDYNEPVERIPKDVMTLGAKKVTFAYSAYELGSYAEGEVELTLEYSQIEEFLTDYGKKLFNRE